MCPMSPIGPISRRGPSMMTMFAGEAERGSCTRGFDFLGYQIAPEGICASPRTRANHAQRIDRLYEQGASAIRIGETVRRWQRWLTSGMGPWKVVVCVCDARCSNPPPPRPTQDPNPGYPARG